MPLPRAANLLRSKTSNLWTDRYAAGPASPPYAGCPFVGKDWCRERVAWPVVAARPFLWTCQVTASGFGPPPTEGPSGLSVDLLKDSCATWAGVSRVRPKFFF